MSNLKSNKGKQWWPLRASLEDSRKAVSEFQDRLREKQWLRSTEKPAIFYVYMMDQVNTDVLQNINQYMQFSASDSSAKNTARAEISRVASVLVKAFLAFRQNGLMAEPPSIFCIPKIKSPGFRYGLIAHFSAEQNDGKQVKPISIIISEHDLSDQNDFSLNKSYVKKIIFPQSGDSYKWLTVKSWQSEKQKISFGKWMYGTYKEKQEWLAAMSQNDLKSNGCFFWQGDQHDQAPKMLGAMFHQSGVWVLPEFWDEFAVKSWLSHFKIVSQSAPVKKYTDIIKNFNPSASQPPPPPEEVEHK